MQPVHVNPEAVTLVNPAPMPVNDAAFTLPLALILPLTSSFWPGDTVPTPTLPPTSAMSTFPNAVPAPGSMNTLPQLPLDEPAPIADPPAPPAISGLPPVPPVTGPTPLPPVPPTMLGLPPGPPPEPAPIPCPPGPPTAFNPESPGPPGPPIPMPAVLPRAPGLLNVTFRLLPPPERPVPAVTPVMVRFPVPGNVCPFLKVTNPVLSTENPPMATIVPLSVISELVSV